MRIIDIIWPWGAHRRAARDRDYWRREAARLENELATANARISENADLALVRALEISRLQRLMKSAHYRDPKTGAIGKKGVFPR